LLPDDADIAASNVITRYMSHPGKLEDVCFADYAALHDGVTTSHGSSKDRQHGNVDDEHNDDDVPGEDDDSSHSVKT